jgi:hypothetical protein
MDYIKYYEIYYIDKEKYDLYFIFEQLFRKNQNSKNIINAINLGHKMVLLFLELQNNINFVKIRGHLIFI